jgi:1,4-dihydroxy-2-naphthoate octaprenyltransferase
MHLTLAKIVRITRAPFLTAAVVPVLLGTAVAWGEGIPLGSLSLALLGLTLLGAVCIHIGLNMSNDYFDHLSGNDEINQELTPFSGGSRVIQEGIIAPRQVLAGSLLFYLLGISIGIYLTAVRGWPVLWLGLAGVLFAFFHNVPRFGLYYLVPGIGELAVGVGFGPISVLGAYYVQTQRLSLGALWASIPVGLLIAAVLYINEFPDRNADGAVGKRTLVVALGRKRAVWGYALLLVLAYGFVVLGVLWAAMPPSTLVALLSLPLAYRGIRGAAQFHSSTPELIPSNAVTIQLHLITGLLLCLGYVVARFL